MFDEQVDVSDLVLTVYFSTNMIISNSIRKNEKTFDVEHTKVYSFRLIKIYAGK